MPLRPSNHPINPGRRAFLRLGTLGLAGAGLEAWVRGQESLVRALPGGIHDKLLELLGWDWDSFARQALRKNQAVSAAHLIQAVEDAGWPGSANDANRLRERAVLCGQVLDSLNRLAPNVDRMVAALADFQNDAFTDRTRGAVQSQGFWQAFRAGGTWSGKGFADFTDNAPHLVAAMVMQESNGIPQTNPIGADGLLQFYNPKPPVAPYYPDSRQSPWSRTYNGYYAELTAVSDPFLRSQVAGFLAHMYTKQEELRAALARTRNPALSRAPSSVLETLPPLCAILSYNQGGEQLVSAFTSAVTNMDHHLVQQPSIDGASVTIPVVDYTSPLAAPGLLLRSRQSYLAQVLARYIVFRALDPRGCQAEDMRSRLQELRQRPEDDPAFDPRIEVHAALLASLLETLSDPTLTLHPFLPPQPPSTTAQR